MSKTQKERKLMNEQYYQDLNEKRAQSAARAVEAFLKVEHCDEEDILCDLLCNLKHWARVHNYDYAAADMRSNMHFDAEMEEAETGVPA